MRITYKQFSNIVMVLACLAICMGLYMRDVMGISINKYLFLLIATIPILMVRFEDVIVFVAFLLPLYVGLPGNYITVVLILRLIVAFYNKEVKCGNNLFWTSLALFAYYFCSNAIYGHMGPYHIVGTFDFIVLALLVNATLQYNKKNQVIFAYGAGAMVVCIIMLMATLRYFTVFELMSESTRLGYTGMLSESSETAMVITLDPNYNGYNVIALLACMYPLSTKLKGFKKLLALTIMFVSVVICLIGLSRAFVIGLIMWVLLLVITERKLWKSVALIVVVCIALVVVYNALPEVIDGFVNRFEGSDVADGNGRGRLIAANFNSWQDSVFNMIFGKGIYNDNTHSAPLLHLFGLGVVGFTIVVLWLVQLIKLTSKYYKTRGAKRFIPFVVTFIMFCTIPAAGALNWMFPLILSIVAMSGERCEIDEKD